MQLYRTSFKNWTAGFSQSSVIGQSQLARIYLMRAGSGIVVGGRMQQKLVGDLATSLLGTPLSWKTERQQHASRALRNVPLIFRISSPTYSSKVRETNAELQDRLRDMVRLFHRHERIVSKKTASTVRWLALFVSIFSISFLQAVSTEGNNCTSIGDEVRSFSSYTKGLFEVIELSVDKDSASFTLLLPTQFYSKLKRRVEKFQSPLISLDGVAATVSSFTEKRGDRVLVIATIAKQSFLSSSLAALEKNDRVSIGLLSINPEKYLLDATFPSKVRFMSAQVAPGHRYTTEFTFECTKEQYEKIQGLQYIGLNGGGFYIQDRKEREGRYYFSIHAGKNTREKTIFGNTQHPINTEFTLTLPYVKM